MNLYLLVQSALAAVATTVVAGLVWAYHYRPLDEYGNGRGTAAGPMGVRTRKRLSLARRRLKESPPRDTATLLYQAGYYSLSARKYFLLCRILCFILCPVLVVVLFMDGIFNYQWVSAIVLPLTLIIGYAAPFAWLNSQVRARIEDILYYLPLVIEQISIGVSGSLDIGPCIAQIVETAHERNSHNPITEMFVHVQKLIRSGLSLETALLEVANVSSIEEVKHAFMFLVQCSRHGGEVSRQLQELADAVTMQRQIRVEARISRLPVKATGPLTVVFAGFFGLLFTGIFARIAGIFL